MTQFGMFPMGLGNHIKYTIHEPLAVKEYDFATLFEKTEQAVNSAILNS